MKENTTYGNTWLYASLVYLLRFVNVNILYIFTSIFIIPITLFLSPGAKLTYHYYHNIRKYRKVKAIWATYLNHCIFSQTVIDKFAMFAGKKYKVNYYGFDYYEHLQEKSAGFIQLGAHIGCSEIIGYSTPVSKTCNVLAYGGEKESLMRMRKCSFANMNIKILPVGFGNTNSEDIVEALERGEIINIFADRMFNKHKVVTSTLHGNSIRLSKGAFSLAAIRELDVVMICGMKEKDGSYSAYLKTLGYDKTLPTKAKIQELADAYTKEIERLMEIYPYQWFNYFNLWNQK